jgi:hypothetical protein
MRRISIGLALLWFISCAAAHACANITSPPPGDYLAGTNVIVSIDQIAAPGAYVTVHLTDAANNDYYIGQIPPNWLPFDSTKFQNGNYWLTVYTMNSSGGVVCQPTIHVIISNASNASGSSSIAQGATISSLTGTASGISGADTNSADYGNYPAWGDNYPLIGGPLLNDIQAASFVKATQQSAIETSSQWGWANQQANSYFNYIASNNPQDYLNQLRAFQSAYNVSPWQPEIDRVDGACPMTNPTTAEVLQWAANKWGINPLLAYASASYESSLNQAGINTHGGSGDEDAGLFQIGDRGANHAYPGFDGYGANLARENSCFNADFWGAWIWAAYRGIVGSPGGDIGVAIESYPDGYATSAGPYTQGVYSYLTQQIWLSWFYNGVPVPY